MFTRKNKIRNGSIRKKLDIRQLMYLDRIIVISFMIRVVKETGDDQGENWLRS